MAELALFSPPKVGAPRAQAPRLHGPRREAGAVSVFRSPGVGLFAPSQRGLSPRGNPRSRHRTRLEVAWDGPGPPDSAPDPSISLSILRSIFDLLPWLRRPGKKGKRSPLFSCARGQKRRQMRPRHSHSEPDSEPPGLIFSSSAAQEVNLSTGTLRTRKTWCQSTTKPRKIGVLGVPPSIPPYPRTRVSRMGPEIDLKYFGGAYALSPASWGP